MALVDQHKWILYRNTGFIRNIDHENFIDLFQSAKPSRFLAFGIGENDVHEFQGWQLITGNDHRFVLVPVSYIMTRDEILKTMDQNNVYYLLLPYDVREHINVI